MRISDWSSDVCSSDLPGILRRQCHRRYQSRGDKGPAQVRDFRCLIGIARIEAGNALSMTCAEDIVVPDDYPTEAPIPARLHYHGKIALTVFMIYAHSRFVYFGKRIALFTQRDSQFQLRGDDLVGIDRVALLDRERLSQSALILAGPFEPRQADCVPPIRSEEH